MGEELYTLLASYKIAVQKLQCSTAVWANSIVHLFLWKKTWMQCVYTCLSYAKANRMLCVKYMYSNCENILWFEIKLHMNLALLCYKSCVWGITVLYVVIVNNCLPYILLVMWALCHQVFLSGPLRQWCNWPEPLQSDSGVAGMELALTSWKTIVPLNWAFV